MSAISFRSNMFGNESEVTFNNADDALKHIMTRPAYEIIPDNALIRPYGDFDGKADDSITYEEFHRIDALLFFSIAQYFQDNSRNITMYSGSDFAYKKWSLRWVIPDYFVKSKKHAKVFASEMYKQIKIPDEFKADLSVYSKSQKMRTLNTSKPNEDRKFYMLQGEEIDTIISYIPKSATLIDFDLSDEDPVEIKESQIYETNYVSDLCDLIDVSAWTDYTICQSLIFSMLSVGCSPPLIHHYCKKAPNYEYKWVDGYCTKYDNTRNTHSIGTIKFFARQGNEVAYKLLSKDKTFLSAIGKTAFEEINQLTTDETTITDHQQSGYLKSLPNHNTLAVKSMLGTGKTRRVIEACNKKDIKTVCVISCRQTFTSHITEELIGFVDYRNIKAKQITDDKVVIQLQSLHRVQNRVFDLVILDEVESILASCSPNKTHKNYLETITAFGSIVKTSKQVISLDAFLTDRTINFLKELRQDVLIVINPHVPYKKTAICYDFEEFKKVLTTELRSKRIVSIWGAKQKAHSFHETLKCSNVLYSADSDAKEKSLHLTDVNKYWKNYQCVAYTPTITVGINYTDTPFDKASVYATSWSCTARDYIQALHRARTLADNEIIAHISPDGKPCSVEAGLNYQEELYNTDTNRKKLFLEQIGEKLCDYTVLPNWIHKVLMWNRNEVVTNWKHFPECMKGYFELCGIDIEERPTYSKQLKQLSERTIVDIDTVPDIEHNIAEQYMNHRTELTVLQQYALEKYYMKQKIVKVDNSIWSTWLKNRQGIENLYDLINRNPRHMIHDKIIDLIPKSIERIAYIQSLKLDWNNKFEISIEEFPIVNQDLFGGRIRTEKDTLEQHVRDFAKSLDNWCGLEMKVKQKQVRLNGTRSYKYTVKYEPTLINYIYKNQSIFESE